MEHRQGLAGRAGSRGPRARRPGVPFALLFVLLLALLALSGCQRGCLSTWIREHGTSTKAAASMTMLNGVDCPDGLARCVGGAVEVSHVARVPRPCSSTVRPEDCQCPWEAVETCPLGCTEDGTEVVVPPERAAARLCAPDPANPPARPAVGAVVPPGACEGEGFRCIGSLVVTCALTDAGLVAQPIAACVRGCFREGESMGDEEADPEGAARILCVR